MHVTKTKMAAMLLQKKHLISVNNNSLLFYHYLSRSVSACLTVSALLRRNKFVCNLEGDQQILVIV